MWLVVIAEDRAAADALRRAVDGRDHIAVATFEDLADLDRADLVFVAPSLTGEVQASSVIALAERAAARVAGASSERRHREGRAQLAERMAAIGTLAGGVAHEINNPLTSAIGNLGLLAEMAEEISSVRPEWAGEFRQLLSEVEEALERMRQVVRELAPLSDPARMVSQRMDVQRVVESMVAMARNEIRHRAAIVRSDDRDLPPVLGDPARLGQVVLNLLINAAQALPLGSADQHWIEVSVRHDPVRRRVTIVVSDTGPGIPAEMQQRIFDPFFSTKDVDAGRGLGLAVCHQIVTSMGGEISVENAAGRGAMFVVSLPAASDRAGSQSGESALPGRRARILIVDDEPAVVEMLQRALARHELVDADNGREALDLLLREPPFDLVLCDLMMPEVTGMDLYQEVIRVRPDLAPHMAFMTGGAFSPSAREFLAGFAPPCLDKPFSVKELRLFVDGLLSRGTK